MEIPFALLAALLFAAGSVFQQKAGMDERPGAGSDAGVLLRMLRKPAWLVGIAADALGYLAQVVALNIGRLAVVQPLLVSSVVFALPLGARITGQRVRRIDIGAAILVTGALVVFLTVADPTGGREDAPIGDWAVVAAIVAPVCAALVLAARRLRPTAKAATLGTATGILFAVSAALTIPVSDQFADEGVLTPLVNWELYALVVVGYASMTLNQLALSTGALAPAVATSMALDPITSVILGTTLLQESLHESPLGWVATIAALLAALAGLAILSRNVAEA